MRSYPRPDRTFGDVDMQTLADRALRIAHGAAEVVCRNRFENHAGWVGFVFSCGCGEFVEALSALKDLEDSVAVLPATFLHREFRAAPNTPRAWLCTSRVGHGGA